MGRLKRNSVDWREFLKAIINRRIGKLNIKEEE